MKKRDVNERFDEKWEYRAPFTCWFWKPAGNPKEYGRIAVGHRDGKKLVSLAHRWSYQRKYGPVPKGLVLDHFKCDTPSCVNPDHVRPVTQRENVLRSDSPPGFNHIKTHCPQGHEYTEENTSLWNRKRKCRTCSNNRRRKSNA